MKRAILLFPVLLWSTCVYSQENCGNGSDDDGDGLIDCLDPDCTGNSVPSGALFNTATNGTGGVLPGGSNDLNWECSIGSVSGPYSPAIVMDPAAIPPSYYPSPWTDCSWISHTASGMHTIDQDFYYRIQFYLPCYNSCGTAYADSAAFCLNMDFYADNSVDEVYVNGIPQSAYIPGVPDPNPYYAYGFMAGNGKSLSLCRDWQPGLNELIIKISSGPSWEGFLAQNSTSAPVPPTGDATILSPGENYTQCDSSAAVTFTAASTGGTWSATCGSCIDPATGVFDPAASGPGTFSVVYSLTVPCPASDASAIEVLSCTEPYIFIPNIFTPNGDDTNDEFFVTTMLIKDIHYDIYDRWGLKIAEHDGITDGWSGRVKSGRMAPDGTYYYLLSATTDDDKLIEMRGFFQLLSK